MTRLCRMAFAVGRLVAIGGGICALTPSSAEAARGYVGPAASSTHHYSSPWVSGPWGYAEHVRMQHLHSWRHASPTSLSPRSPPP